MKRNFIKNIFLSAMIVAGSKVAVDRAFEAQDVSYDVNLSKLSQITLFNTMDSAKEEVELIDFSDIETLDDNTRFASNGAINKETQKITYIKDIKKPIEFTNTNVKATVAAAGDNVEVIGETFDLSLNEVEVPAQIKVRELPRVAWTELYEPIENSLTTDRISTVVAGIEKSESVSSPKAKVQPEKIIDEVKTVQSSLKNDEMHFINLKDDAEFTEGKSDVKVAKAASTSSANMTSFQKAYLNQRTTKEDLINVLEESIQKAQYEKVAKHEKEEDKKEVKKEPSKKPEKPTHGFVSASTEESYGCYNEAQESNNKPLNAKYEIQLSSVDYSKKKLERVHNFELRFEDDIDEIYQDYGEGKVSLDFKVNSEMNTRRVSIYQKNHVSLEMDFAFEGSNSTEVNIANIPAFEIDTFKKLVKGNGLQGNGGHILVELDDKTEDVEVETQYEAKFFLDKNLKAVDRNDSGYSFLLFVGVKPGNTVVDYKNTKNEIANRVVYVSNEKVYYDPNFYAEVKVDRFNTYEEQLLSKCKSLLNVEKKDVTPFSFDAKVKKKSLNKLEVGRTIYPIGTRKYYEFKHLNESVIVGRWGAQNLILPSEDYISHVISQFEVTGQSKQCLVQLNLRKTAKELYFNSLSPNRGMQAQVNILDKDGQFYDGLSPESERIFLMGEEAGVINIKVKYIDGSTDYLQSFCTESTYVIEQL